MLISIDLFLLAKVFDKLRTLCLLSFKRQISCVNSLCLITATRFVKFLKIRQSKKIPLLTRSARMKSPVSEGSMYPSLSSSSCLWSSRIASRPTLSSVECNKTSYSDSGELVVGFKQRRAKNATNVLVRLIISIGWMWYVKGR